MRSPPWTLCWRFRACCCCVLSDACSQNSRAVPAGDVSPVTYRTGLGHQSGEADDVVDDKPAASLGNVAGLHKAPENSGYRLPARTDELRQLFVREMDFRLRGRPIKVFFATRNSQQDARQP